jgi:apurinic endonuclease APN1
MQICNLDWKCGCHTPFLGKISDTLKLSINYGMYTTQFFMGSPQSYNRSKISKEDIKEAKKILLEYPMDVYSHYPYLSNLTGSVSSLAWNGDENQNKKTMALLESIEYELNIMSQIGSGVVIHPGNYKDREIGLKTISESINKINFPKNSKLLLENSAGKGVSLATTFLEIDTIIEGVLENKKSNIGVCIDTCHIFDYGEYNLRDIEEIDRMFIEFDNEIGLKNLKLIHLNDSTHGLKSKRDEHASLGNGHIWKDNMECLRFFMIKTKKMDIPIVLETCVSDLITLSKINLRKI